MDEVGDDWVSGVRPPPTSQVATHLPSSVSFLPTSRAVRVRVFLVLGRVYIGAFCGNKSIVDSVSLAPNRIVSPPPPHTVKLSITMTSLPSTEIGINRLL